MFTYEAALSVAIPCVQRSLRHQVRDPDHPAHGAFLNEANAGAFPSADHVSNAADLAVACQVFLAPESPLEENAELLTRIRDSIAFQRRWQRPSGLIDLAARNIESPPDTGFTVEMLAHVVAAARCKAESPGARLIASELGEYVRSAAVGMIDRGFHTPNHRWVVCAALAAAMKLFPDIPGRHYVQRILAEGIDIQADGEYTERSNGIYNAVCNRCLITMADNLDRPDLLDPVRRNLDFTVSMLRDDGTVETGFSTRQDRHRRIVPSGMIDSFLEMAHRDNNGIWAAAADLLFDHRDASADRAGSALLQPFLSKPQRRRQPIEREPLPDHFRKYLPVSKLWRIKRGPLSAIAMADQRHVFSLRFGKVSLRGVKVSGAYHGHAHARPTEMQAISDSSVRLAHYGRTTDFAGFFLPLNRPVEFGRFREAEPLREKWSLPELDITMDIMEVDRGFDLHLCSSGGNDRAPMEIEFSFDGIGAWETTDTVLRAGPGQSVLLKAGHGTFRVGDDAIMVGLGSFSHHDWDLRESQPSADAFRVLSTFTTPFDHVVQIRYGYWSLATRSLMQP